MKNTVGWYNGWHTGWHRVDRQGELLARGGGGGKWQLKSPQQQEMEGMLQGHPPLMLLAQTLGPCWNRRMFASLKISNLKVHVWGVY